MMKLSCSFLRKNRICTGLLLFLLLIMMSAIFCACSGGQINSASGIFSNQSGSAPLTEESLVTLNTSNEPVFAISPGGQIAWLVMNDDGSTGIYLYGKESNSQIPGGDNFVNGLQVNDEGQVVWAGYDGNDSEIYLYSNGTTSAITSNLTDDSIPRINSRGQIVWTGYDDNSNSQVFMYDDGLISQISGAGGSSSPLINEEGDVAWIGSSGGESQVYLWKNNDVTRVSISSIDYLDDDSPLEEVRLNGSGELAWTGPIEDNLQIFFYGNGQAEQLTSGGADHRGCQMNDEGQVVWTGYDGNDTEIYLYSNGVVTQVSDNTKSDLYPSVNNGGQIVWQSYDGDHYQIYVYDNGKTELISHNDYDNVNPFVTEDGSIYWVTREWQDGWYYRNIYMASPQSYKSGRGATEQENQSAAYSRESAQLLDYAKNNIPPQKGKDSASSFSFVVLGDSRSNSSNSHMNEDFLKFFVNKVTQEIKPQFVVFNGDQVMDCEIWQNSQWQYQEKPWTDLMGKIKDAGIPLYLVKGNHEIYAWKEGDRDSKGRKSPHIRMLAQDAWQNDPEIHKYTLGSYPDSSYKWLAYTFEYGNSFFLIFDAFHAYKAYSDADIKIHPLRYYNDESHYATVGDTHLAWIQSQVSQAADSQKYRHMFAVSHAPVFSMTDGYKNAKENMLKVWKAIDDAKFDIYFGAHEHLYSRRTIDPNIQVQSGGTLYSFKNNVLQIISGDAGASPVTQWVENKQDWHIEPAWNYVIVTVNGDTATYNAYKVDKNYSITVFDSGTTTSRSR